MKLIPQNLRAPNMNDSVGRGMDMALTMALFIGIGYGLDRWLGTTPWFMIGLSLLAAIGLFARFKYQYDAAMEEHEAERLERAGVGKADDHDG
jgi:F0F1-type ATP synthase assembly protein I